MDKTKKIAVNTIFLCFRMLVLMLISFYSSRVLLKELGVTDFGIYGLVGGVVAIFSSLRGLFATATQRFLNYEMGNDNIGALQKVFNMSILINVIISLVFCIIAEGIGLWFLNNKLVIDSARMVSAHWAFHLSILASMVSIMTIPFDAVIIAHERMSFYAFISILNAFLRLGAILILPFFAMDKLQLYSMLILAVSLLMRLLCSIYCKVNFEECKYKFYWNKSLFKEMGSFAGWNLAGSFAYSYVNEGLNIVLNLFGGVVVNAARTIAYQIKNAITTLLYNVMLAIQPQATQLYAKGEFNSFFKMLFVGARVVVFFYLSIAFPVYFYIEDILSIWLTTVPEHTIAFVRTILIYLAIRSFHEPIDIFYMIIGKLKVYQITEFIVLGAALPLSYIVLKYTSLPLYSVFIIMAIVEFINFFIILYIAKRIGRFDLELYVKKVFVPFFYTFFCMCFCSYLINIIYNSYEYTAYYCILPILINVLCFCGISLMFGFNLEERKALKRIILRK